MTVNSPATDNTSKPRGRLATVFAIFAFIACNGLVILLAVLSAIGVSVSINPHIQAAAISLFYACQAAISALAARSISASVEGVPSDKRTAPRARSAAIPIAPNTPLTVSPSS